MTNASTAKRETETDTAIDASRKIIPLAKHEAKHEITTDAHAVMEAGWARIRTRLKADLGDNAWRHWIRRLHIDTASRRDGVIVFTTSSSLVAQQVKGRYADRLAATCRLEWPQLTRVEIRHDRSNGLGDAALPDAHPAHDAPAPAPDGGAEDYPDFGARLDARMTFANFITDESNQLAFSVAEKTAHAATPIYNPLFLHGGVGFGKTHLMQAMAMAIRGGVNPRRVVYMNAEDFVRQFIAACRANNTLGFKNRMRGVDVFMIDDMQFMGGKQKACEEFLHTFTALAGAGRQIVIAADRPPAEIEGIGERLRSRLNQGMVASITAPGYALRLAMIERADRENNLGLDSRVMEFLAQHITSNLRELEGALNRLAAHKELADTGAYASPLTPALGPALNMESVRRILADVIAGCMQQVSIAEIKRTVARFYKIRVEDIISSRRPRSIVIPRQIAMYLAKNLTPASYPEIGRQFGGRDHTTVMYAVKKIEELQAGDAETARAIAALTAAIGGGGERE